MRHVHRTDLTFLEAFRDDTHAGASPISAIAVLSRADEVGACRLDAMGAAQRIADGWRSDPRLRRLCQTVVPVAGLLAETGATLREDEYRASPRRRCACEVDAMLLTTDRFVNDVTTSRNAAQTARPTRVFGVRTAISLVAGAAPAWCAGGRAHARSRAAPRQSRWCSASARRPENESPPACHAGYPDGLADAPRSTERTAGAHEFTEVYLLNASSGALPFRQAEADEPSAAGSIGAGGSGSDRPRRRVVGPIRRRRTLAAAVRNPMTPRPAAAARESPAPEDAAGERLGAEVGADRAAARRDPTRASCGCGLRGARRSSRR
jgi:hypothetical protein